MPTSAAGRRRTAASSRTRSWTACRSSGATTFWRDTIAAETTADDPDARTWVVEEAGGVRGFAATGPDSRPAGRPRGRRRGLRHLPRAGGARPRPRAGAVRRDIVDDLAARGFDPVVVWVFEANAGHAPLLRGGRLPGRRRAPTGRLRRRPSLPEIRYRPRLDAPGSPYRKYRPAPGPPDRADPERSTRRMIWRGTASPARPASSALATGGVRLRLFADPRRTFDERLLWSRDIRFVHRLAAVVAGSARARARLRGGRSSRPPAS